MDKKLIIELHYRRASGRTLASLCESFRVFGEWGRREENIREQRGGTLGNEAKSRGVLTANKSRTAAPVNQLKRWNAFSVLPF